MEAYRFCKEQQCHVSDHDVRDSTGAPRELGEGYKIGGGYFVLNLGDKRERQVQIYVRIAVTWKVFGGGGDAA